jgi:hypothetical protein
MQIQSITGWQDHILEGCGKHRSILVAETDGRLSAWQPSRS